MTRRRLLTVFLLVLVVAGACGDDGTEKPTFHPDRDTVERKANDPDVVAARMDRYLDSLSNSGRQIVLADCPYRRLEVVVPNDVATEFDQDPAIEQGSRPLGENFTILTLVDRSDADAAAYAIAHQSQGVIPHYILSLDQEYKWGPGSAPVPSDEEWTVSPFDDSSNVVVFDTASSLTSGGYAPYGHDDDLDGDDYLDPVAGHGDFVVSIIQREGVGVRPLIDPRADDGMIDLESFDEAVRFALVEFLLDPPYVFNLSFGTCALPGPEGELFPTALADTVGLLLGMGDSAVVASAGNDAFSRPHYPAAFAGVFGVGALDSDGRAAEFSNCGEWVNVWAPGVAISGPYPSGSIQYDINPDVSAESVGAAVWSGTSFAAPIVTASVAQNDLPAFPPTSPPSPLPYSIDNSGHCSPRESGP